MRNCLLLILVALFQIVTVTDLFAHEAATSELIDVRTHRGCAYCGMDRLQSSRTRVQITYSDNSVMGLCSVRCLIIELKLNKHKTVKSIEVADYQTNRLINATTAYWVVGGKIKGVMTSTAKWAFADKSSAEAFIRVNGGHLSSYEKVIAIAKIEK